MSVEITIRGNVGDSISVREGQRNGDTYKVLSFTIASTKFKKQLVNGQEEYVPDKTTWYNCAYWNKDSDVIHKSLQKGLPVTVVGEVVNVGTYASKQTGEILPSVDVRVDSIYLNLNSKRIDKITLLPAREANGGPQHTGGDPMAAFEGSGADAAPEQQE